MNLHAFGLSGVQRPSFYEGHPEALSVALRRWEAEERLMQKAPNLARFLRSDPGNGVQEATRSELRSVVDAALEMGGLL